MILNIALISYGHTIGDLGLFKGYRTQKTDDPEGTGHQI